MTGQERRRFPRIPLLAEAHVVIDGEVTQVRTRDLSIGGVSIEFVEGALVAKPQSACRFRLRLPGHDEIEIDSSLAWRRAKTAGVRFMKLETEHETLLKDEIARVHEELQSLEAQATPT